MESVKVILNNKVHIESYPRIPVKGDTIVITKSMSEVLYCLVVDVILYNDIPQVYVTECNIHKSDGEYYKRF